MKSQHSQNKKINTKIKLRKKQKKIKLLKNKTGSNRLESPSWIIALSQRRGCVTQWNYEPRCPCRATQDRQVIVKSSDKLWSTGEGNGKPLQYSYLQNLMRRLKDRMLEDELPRSEGVQYATGEERRTISNSYGKNEAPRPKPEWCSDVDVSGGESKVWCCKEQYWIGTWNVRSMNQCKLDVDKQEM